MRLLVALSLIAVSCTSSPSVGPPDLIADDAWPITCGPLTCEPRQICMIFTPGVPPPPDGGNGYQYSCIDMPSECANGAAHCGTTPTPPGCFHAVCQGEPSCLFDGTTLTCIGI